MALSLKSIISSVTGLPLWVGDTVAGVSVSCKVSESHKFQNNVTDVTLENGAVVSDHVIRTPDEVTVIFEMTNAGLLAKSEAISAFEELREILDTRETVTLVTEHKIYDNVVLVDFSPVHQAPNKGALSCSATFREINFVTLDITGKQASKCKGTAKKTATETFNKGQQAAKPLKKTELKGLWDKFRG